MRRPGAAEAHLLRKATWTFALQTALAVAVAVVLAGVIATVAGSRVLAADAAADARRAAVQADDVNDPPPGVFLVAETGNGATRASATAPTAVRAVRPEALPAGSRRLGLGGRQYQAYTVVNPRHHMTRVTALVDLTARSETEEELLQALFVGGAAGVLAAGLVGWLIGRRAVRPLGHALALQRQFVADASHELRTPLTTLYTRIQLLRRRTGAAVGVRDQLDRLAEDARGLDEVLSDLLVSAALSAEPDRAYVNVHALAASVVASMRVRAQALDVDLTAEGEADCVVAGSAGALRRAVTALVDNALTHAARPGHVQVVTWIEGGHAVVEVRDDGVGFDPDRLDELTRRFARGPDDSGPGRRRFGLGLALVREIVEAHAGRLEATRSPAGGAAFRLVLPEVTGRRPGRRVNRI